MRVPTIWVCALCALFLAIGCVSAEADMAVGRLGAGPSAPGRRSILPEAWAAPAKAPPIDGVLDDAAWKQAQPLLMRPVIGRGRVGAETRVRLLHDRTNLYIGIELDEPEIDKIKRNVSARDGRAYSDDSVEIWLQPRRRV